MKMMITIFSGISADGFSIEIDNIKQSYYYGYDASYDKRFASAQKPYTADIIADWMQTYGITKDEIEVVQGKNIWTNKPVDDNINEFIARYIERKEL